MSDAPKDPGPIQRLLDVMARLRDPEGGCPWDVEQTFATIAPYTIEEAYEVADAIERNDLKELKEELGDLLFQVVFHARMAEEAGHWGFDDVVEAVAEKLIRRHPHVFADAGWRTSQEQTVHWEQIKAEERKGKAKHGVLDDVPVGLPALTRAVKLTRRAGRVGFDWPTTDEVIAKLHEELDELREEIAAGNRDKVRDEMGDVLFVVANLARKLDVEPEDALRASNAKFVRRFHHIEARLAETGRKPEDSDLEEMDGLWNEARRADKAAR